MRLATLVVTDPNGRRTRIPLSPLPFGLGRAPGNTLVLRDSRISRNHAQIVVRDDNFFLEDLGSRHGVWLNGEKIDKPCILRGSERIEFGVPGGYQIHFAANDQELERLHPPSYASQGSRGSGSASLEKLKAVLEVARSLQNSFSVDDVLNTVLDAALAATGAERGFLLLFDKDRDLQLRSARSTGGGYLPPDELRVPRGLIQRALESRRDLFSMSFDPAAAEGNANNTITDLELRSVVCIPLVHVSLSGAGDTQLLSAARASAGVLYLDSRVATVDLAGGNRELLQTLAIEASTVLENARLLEQERGKQRMEEELDVARRIQQSLLPISLPSTGWFVAAGSSEPSHQVGGDYFDVVPIGPDLWSFAVADVSGKGVSASLVTSFLQGALLGASSAPDVPEVFARINTFLCERAGHGKYATLYYGMLDVSGQLSYINAGHCPPLLLGKSGKLDKLVATSMPVGLSAEAQFGLAQVTLTPGDRLILYSDGVTEAHNERGEFYGRKRLRESVERATSAGCMDLWSALRKDLLEFTTGVPQADDVTLVVIEYRGRD
jgi:phosphoserine phosphatase RsbU/P